MRELADISLFMKNCGQGQSDVSVFGTVAVNNNQGGIDRFMSEEFKHGRCGDLVRSLFIAIAHNTRKYDGDTAVNIGMSDDLGECIAGKIIREIGRYTIPAIRSHFDSNYDLPTNADNIVLRDKEHPLMSDGLDAMLEFDDIPQFVKELTVNMKAYYSEWYQENYGDMPTKDMMDWCGSIADGVGKRIDAEVVAYSGLGDKMVDIMKTYKKENGGVDISFEEFAEDHGAEFTNILQELGGERAVGMISDLLNSVSKGLHRGKTVEDMDEPDLTMQDFLNNWPLSKVKNADRTGQLVNRLIDGLLKR